MPDPENNYPNCCYCNDVVTFGMEYRHYGGKLCHVSCLIQKLEDEVRDLKNPLTGEVQDDSIPRAFKKLRSALREYNRIVNSMTLHRHLLNDWYGSTLHKRSSMYKHHVGVTWGTVKDIAAKAVRKAVADLERLT